MKTGAVTVVKDADFSHLPSITPGCRVVWLRFGNAASASLLRSLEPIFGEVERALAEGQNLVEGQPAAVNAGDNRRLTKLGVFLRPV